MSTGPSGRRPVYGIAGGGRLAYHWRRYLELLQLPCRQWSRKASDTSPRKHLSGCGTIIIAINDDALEPFIRANFLNTKAVMVHCSGVLSTPLAHSAHPLAVLGSAGHALEFYSKILFVTEKGRPSFSKLFPELPNPHVALSSKEKPYYHALCAMSGNFSSYLWRRFFEQGERELGLPRKALLHYWRSAAANIGGPCDLTGPLARGDRATVRRHLSALKGDMFESIYRAFAETFASSKGGM